MQDTIWNLSPFTDSVTAISQELDLPLPIAQILNNRGITHAQTAQSFLYGTLDDLYDPFLIPDMPAAVERLKKAVHQGENILIFGDYDVDGVLSVVILTRALRSLGANVDYYIPDRLKEGYGLKPNRIPIVLEKKANLVISVDCGIKAIEFVKEANKIGVDVIITDHHQPGSDLPNALAILNPVLKGSSYPEKNLAGIGVVFKLIQALFMNHPQEIHLPHYLKLVSIGTVADVVSLRNENRLFVKFGLQGLCQVTNKGLLSLLDVCGLSGKKIQVGDLGFRIGPRINAAGRLGKAELAVKLFLSESDGESKDIAKLLNTMNSERQAVEKKIFNQAFGLINSKSLWKRYKLLILGCEEWHRGVIGIVASKLKDTFYRPVILFAYEDGNAYGSGRSIKEFPLIDCLNDNLQYFLNYGGHPMAVGCEMKHQQMSGFKAAINTYVSQRLSDMDLKRKIRIDVKLPFDEINDRFLDCLNLLSPFGMGNPKPTFLTEDVQILSEPRLLQNKHSKWLVKHNERTFELLGWDKADLAQRFNKGDRVHIVYTLNMSEYMGEQRLSLFLEDIKPSY